MTILHAKNTTQLIGKLFKQYQQNKTKHTLKILKKHKQKRKTSKKTKKQRKTKTKKKNKNKIKKNEQIAKSIKALFLVAQKTEKATVRCTVDTYNI